MLIVLNLAIFLCTILAYFSCFRGEDGAWHLEEGDFSIGIGGLRRRIHCNRTSTWK